MTDHNINYTSTVTIQWRDHPNHFAEVTVEGPVRDEELWPIAKQRAIERGWTPPRWWQWWRWGEAFKG